LIKLSKNSTTVTFEPWGCLTSSMRWPRYSRCIHETRVQRIFSFSTIQLSKIVSGINLQPALPIREWKTFKAFKGFPFANLCHGI